MFWSLCNYIPTDKHLPVSTSLTPSLHKQSIHLLQKLHVGCGGAWLGSQNPRGRDGRSPRVWCQPDRHKESQASQGYTVSSYQNKQKTHKNQNNNTTTRNGHPALMPEAFHADSLHTASPSPMFSFCWAKSLGLLVSFRSCEAWTAVGSQEDRGRPDD